MSHIEPYFYSIERSLREIIDFSIPYVNMDRLESETADLFTPGNPVSDYLIEQARIAWSYFCDENPELESEYSETIFNLINNMALPGALAGLYVGYEESVCFENSVFGQKHADEDSIYVEQNPTVIAGRSRDIVDYPADHFDKESFKGWIKELFDKKNPVSEYLEEQKSFLVTRFLDDYPEFAKPEYSVALNNLAFQMAGVYSLASSLTGFEEGAYFGNFVFGQKHWHKGFTYVRPDSHAIAERLRDILDHTADHFDRELFITEATVLLTPGNPVVEYVHEQDLFLRTQFFDEYPELEKPKYDEAIGILTGQIVGVYSLAGLLTGYERGLYSESPDSGKQEPSDET